jgi:hypothetical protein
MGRPDYPAGAAHKDLMNQRTDAIRRFSIVENSPANASNGLCVTWGEQDAFELDRLLRGM